MLSPPLRRKFRSLLEEKESKTLPDDIIEEILLRLPAESLWHFSCVCRLWRDLISSQRFISHYQHRLNENHDFIFVQRSKGIAMIDCVTLSDIEMIDLPCGAIKHDFYWHFCSCNGLVCIVDEYDGIWLWNPCTQKHRRLPPSNYGTEDWRNRPSSLGFGYESSSNEYLIVRVFSGGYGHSKVDLYSLNKNLWTMMENIPYLIYPSFNTPTVLDGVLHWKGVVGISISKIIIIAFDIRGKIFQAVELPCDCQCEQSSIRIVVVDECLSVCHWQDSYLEVWVMMEYGVRDSWVKMYNIREPTRMDVIAVSKKGELMMGKRSGTGGLLLYDIKTQSSRELDIQMAQFGFPAIGISFVKSLAPL